jgi:hypothetical protein
MCQEKENNYALVVCFVAFAESYPQKACRNGKGGVPFLKPVNGVSQEPQRKENTAMGLTPQEGRLHKPAPLLLLNGRLQVEAGGLNVGIVWIV